MVAKKTPVKNTSVKPNIVKMVRGDKTADVHPDEVKNWSAAGWVKA